MVKWNVSQTMAIIEKTCETLRRSDCKKEFPSVKACWWSLLRNSAKSWMAEPSWEIPSPSVHNERSFQSSHSCDRFPQGNKNVFPKRALFLPVAILLDLLLVTSLSLDQLPPFWCRSFLSGLPWLQLGLDCFGPLLPCSVDRSQQDEDLCMAMATGATAPHSCCRSCSDICWADQQFWIQWTSVPKPLGDVLIEQESRPQC